MAFLQLATETSQPFIIEGVSPITPASSRKNSLRECTSTATATTTAATAATTQSFGSNTETCQRRNSLTLL